MKPSSAAVFLDRDGTIIEDIGYANDPVQVKLLPGSGEAIRALNSAGIPAIVVSNQSGIARGLLSVEDYQRTETRLDELLSRQGSHLTAHFYCPHLPEINGNCECRKPGTLLYRRAAARFDLDLEQSWWVGDRLRDVLPSISFGGHGILVLTGSAEALARPKEAARFPQVPNLPAAVERILAAVTV